MMTDKEFNNMKQVIKVNLATAYLAEKDYTAQNQRPSMFRLACADALYLATSFSKEEQNNASKKS